MNKSQTQYLELLKAGLWGIAPDLDIFRSGGIDWKAICRISNAQAVTVVVSDGIETLPEELWPPIGVVHKFAMARIKTAQMHNLLNSTLAQVVRALETEGVHSVLLKGQGVAQNYRNPSSRACGDLDIYTGDGGYKRAFEIIESLQDGQPHREAAECIHHLHTSLNGVEVEIHRQASIVHGKRMDRKLREWTKQSIDDLFGTGKLETWNNNGTPVSLPSPTFNSFFILHHAVRHMTVEGVGFRQICDWMMLLHRYHSQIDAELLKEKLKEQHMLKVWEEFGRLVVNYLGLPANELPLAPANLAPTCRTSRLLDEIFVSGNFGRYDVNGKDRSKAPYLIGKWRSMTYQTKRLFRLFRLFPGYSMVYLWHWFTGAIVRFITQTDK